MKRVSICAILAIFLAAGFVSAQESSGEPSADSVLQKARDKYNGTTSTQDTTGTPEAAGTPTAADQPNTAEVSADSASGAEPEAGSRDKKSEYPYSLAVIGIVPGLSFPMGIYDTNLAVAVSEP